MRGSESEATAPRWPAWFGPVAFVAAFVIAATVAGVLYAIDGSTDDLDDSSPLIPIGATFAQDLALIGVPIALAFRRGRPNLADFGWRIGSRKRAVIALTAALAGFYGFSAIYTAIFDPTSEQDVLETLGADRSSSYLILSAAIVIILAPICEETFFRGFFYRALRNRMSVWGAAAVVAVLFGSIHYSGPDTLILLPVLAVLGAIFCLMYEYSGSLLPAVGLHTINNSIAFAIEAPSDAAPTIAVVMAAATFIVAALVPARSRLS